MKTILQCIAGALAVAVLLAGCDGGSSGGGQSASTAIIIVDGDASDWAQSEYAKPVYRDAAGDADSSVAGSDIIALYIAYDSQNIYVRVDVANGPPASSLLMGIAFPASRHEGNTPGDKSISVEFDPMSCSAWVDTETGSSLLGWGQLAVQGNVIEMSVRRQDLDPPSPSYVECWTYMPDMPDSFDTSGGPGIPVNF